MRSISRVVVRVSDDPVPLFLARTVEELGAVEDVELVLLIVDRSGAGFGRRRADRWYDTVERRIFRGGPPALADGALPMPDVPRANASGEAAWTLVREHGADVLIDLGDRPLPPSDASVALPLGWWSLRFAAGVDGRRGSCIPRYAAADGLGLAILEARSDDGVAVELERVVGTLAAVGHVRSRDALLWAASNLPARALRRAARARAQAGSSDGLKLTPATGRDPGVTLASTDRRTRPTRRPGWARLALATAGRVAERLWYRESWVVLTREGAEPGTLPHDLAGFLPVAPPTGRFFADPFVHASADGLRLYVEVSRVGRHEGSIAVLTRGPDGAWGGALPVLTESRHLAYPHVITIGDSTVLTPDDGRSDAVTAYRQAGTGQPWQPAATILAGVRAADPTLLEHDGRLWLFVALATHGMSASNELHLYSARDLAGPWEPHPANPIVADVRRARPAGRIIRVGNRLIRPGQDCAELYGRRIVLSEITRLDRDHYEEQVIGTIEPTGQPGARRTHTYTVAGGVEAVDAFLQRPRLAGLRSPDAPRASAGAGS